MQYRVSRGSLVSPINSNVNATIPKCLSAGYIFNSVYTEPGLNVKAATVQRDWVAIACALTAVAIWGWGMSATRVAAKQDIAPIDVALLRYSVPALLLLPVWLATLRKLKRAPLWSIFAMLGWGAPFLWLVTASLKDTEVIYLATIVPCTMPLIAMAAERIWFSNKPTRAQLIGCVFIAASALLVILKAIFGGVNLASISLMLLAATGWSAYVISFRHTGLTAAEGAAWVCVASTVIILVIKFMKGGELLPLTTEQIIFNAFAQGFVSGFVAVLTYTIAIARLGTAQAASYSVLVPALASFFAWVWLNEIPTWFNLFALLLGTIGVAVINGLLFKQVDNKAL